MANEKKLKALLESQYNGKGGKQAAEDLGKVSESAKKSSTALDNLKKGSKGLDGALGDIRKSVMSNVLGFATLGGAVVAAGSVVRSSVTEWVAYNEEMRKLGEATSTSTEDLSRLVQAADDLGISMMSMSTALTFAAKNGVQPTIENIANLADELNAIRDPTERAERSAALFGRGWAEISGFLNQGGDAIRRTTAAIDENLVATETSVRQARELSAAQDELNDRITALKNQLAQNLIPSLIEAVKWMDILIKRGFKPSEDAIARQSYEIYKASENWDQYSAAVQEQALQMGYSTRAAQEYAFTGGKTNEVLGAAIEILDENGKSVGVLTERVYNMHRAYFEADAILEQYTTNQYLAAYMGQKQYDALYRVTEATEAGTEALTLYDLQMLQYNARTEEGTRKGIDFSVTWGKVRTNLLSAGDAAARLGDKLRDIPTDIGNTILEDLRALDYQGAGATMVEGLRQEIMANLEKGLITQDQAENALAALFVAFEVVKTKAGDLSKNEAWGEIRENLSQIGLTAEQAKLMFEQLMAFDGKTINFTALMDLIARFSGLPGNIPAGAGNKSKTGTRTGQDSGGDTYMNAKGTDYTVPSGYPNDTYPLGFAQSGEHVTITPAGKQPGGGDVITYVGGVVVYEAQDAQETADAVVAAINRRMRSANAAGARYSKG